MEEYENIPEDHILDIAIDNWDPHQFTQDKHALTLSTLLTSPEDDIQPSFDLIDDPFDIFMDCNPILDPFQDAGKQITQEEEQSEEFHDAREIPEDNQKIPGRVMHLTIDYQTIGKWEKGRQVCHMAANQVSEFLEDLDYYQLVGRHESFDTLSAAINTSQQLEKIEQELDIPGQIWQAQTNL